MSSEDEKSQPPDPNGIFIVTEINIEDKESVNESESPSLEPVASPGGTPFQSQSSKMSRMLEPELAAVMEHRVDIPTGFKTAVSTEVVLKQAPFAQVASSALRFWRDHLTRPEFQTLMTEGFWWFSLYDVCKSELNPLADEVSTADPIFGRMASSFVGAFKHIPTGKKDTFFDHFYEAMAFGILICLARVSPERHPAFDTTDFRRRLIDRCSLWTRGLRPHFVPSDHWILQADPSPLKVGRGRGNRRRSSVAADSSQKLSDTATRELQKLNFTLGAPPPSDKGLELPPLIAPARAGIKMSNSPFMNRWMKDNSLEPPSWLTCEATITQDRNRPVLFERPMKSKFTKNHQPEGTPLSSGGDEELRAAFNDIRGGSTWSYSEPQSVDSLKSTDAMRSDILQKYEAEKRNSRKEMSTIRRKFKEETTEIDRKSQKALARKDVHEYSNFILGSIQEDVKKKRLARAEAYGVPPP
mmetsp:Transcript_60255/g.82639  ORF Transcript_60255/g.82639 Transcript_60255/m.82639 type:complete len:470 (-) Transcript_60255:201-1610(-)